MYAPYHGDNMVEIECLLIFSGQVGCVCVKEYCDETLAQLTNIGKKIGMNVKTTGTSILYMYMLLNRRGLEKRGRVKVVRGGG